MSLERDYFRKWICRYFLISAIPFGLFALFGDFMFGSAIWDEIANFYRRPHSWNSLENFSFISLYLILVNCGFLFLIGYGQDLSTSKGWNSRYGFWIASTLYNVSLAIVSAFYVISQMRSAVLNPLQAGFWMILVPVFGAILSAYCLRRNSRNAFGRTD
jgi:hypothetical protein